MRHSGSRQGVISGVQLWKNRSGDGLRARCGSSALLRSLAVWRWAFVIDIHNVGFSS